MALGTGVSPWGLSFNPSSGTLFYTNNLNQTVYEIGLDGSGDTSVLTIPGADQLLGMAFTPTGDMALSSDHGGGTIYLFDGDGDGYFNKYVPEPSALLLLLAGIIALAGIKHEQFGFN